MFKLFQKKAEVETEEAKKINPAMPQNPEEFILQSEADDQGIVTEATMYVEEGTDLNWSLATNGMPAVEVVAAYQKEGVHLSKMEFLDQNDNTCGEYRSYHSSGFLSLVENYENSVFHGQRTTYFEDGKVEGIKTFSHGALHGVAEDYHDNGQLQLRRSYDHGIWDGEIEAYHANTYEVVSMQSGDKNEMLLKDIKAFIKAEEASNMPEIIIQRQIKPSEENFVHSGDVVAENADEQQQTFSYSMV